MCTKDRSPHLSTTASSVTTIVSIVVLARIGQRIGRRKLLMIWALVMAFVVSASFLLLVTTAKAGAPNWVVGLIYVIAKTIPTCRLGVILTYLNERFPASVRASGYGIGYMFGLILPGLYTFWLLWLSHLIPYEYGPIVPILLGGLLMFWAVRRGPKTNTAATAVPAPTMEAA